MMWTLFLLSSVFLMDPVVGDQNCRDGGITTLNGDYRYDSNCNTTHICKDRQLQKTEPQLNGCPAKNAECYGFGHGDYHCGCKYGFEGTREKSGLLLKCERLCTNGDFRTRSGSEIIHQNCTKKSMCDDGTLVDTQDYTCPEGSGCVKNTCHAPPCTDGYQFYEYSRICIKVNGHKRVTWDEARALCKNDGGDLVHIHTHRFNNFVKAFLTRRHRYWIGVRSEDGQWKYASGQSMMDYHYHPWAYREPNNHLGWEWCLEIIGNKKGTWNDKRCSRRRPFVCEKYPSVIG